MNDTLRVVCSSLWLAIKLLLLFLLMNGGRSFFVYQNF